MKRSSARRCAADLTDRPQLAVHEALAGTRREGERGRGLEQARVRNVVAVQPTDVHRGAGLQWDLVLTVVDLQQCDADSGGRQRLERSGDRRERGFVADEQVPINVGPRRVRPSRTHEVQEITRPRRARPRSGDAVVSVDDEVDRELARSVSTDRTV